MKEGKMRTTIIQIKEMKQKGKKIPMLTAYDYATAKLIDGVGIPLILVGDSLGMVVLGYESTIPVTMDEMLHHTKAVVRGTEQSLIIGDMPFMTYHASVGEALHHAARFIQEGGAQAVKLEGGETMAETVRRIVECGIPVMGHIGLTPQSVHQLGGFKVQGKSIDQAKRVVEDAIAIEEAGAFAIVLEAIPRQLSAIITERLKIPTIGIGGGVDCDGQVLVLHDLVGLFRRFTPKFVKVYADLYSVQLDAVKKYIADVQGRSFPADEHTFTMKEEAVAELRKSLGI
jgi:3-methyl-2-oxobutanoate hydroxymethyltransferase